MCAETGTPPTNTLRDLVDLERYPIDALDGAAGRALVNGCRYDLRARGACQLEGFLRRDAVDALAAEAAALAQFAFRNESVSNVYFEDIDDSLPEDDPRRLLERASQAAVAYDLIPAAAGVRALYESNAMLAFVGAALDKDPFFRTVDPLGALNVVYYRAGDELGWHFDRSEFSVTLMLQPAESGGDFEYIPNLRTGADENYAGVRRLLLGDMTGVIHAPSTKGTLAFFRGHHSIHRVTPIVGDVLRTNAVLTYADVPDQRLNRLTQEIFYGRTA